MARTESTATGGYFPTPAHLLPAIARLVRLEQGPHAVLDPCAGDGSALFDLGALWGGYGKDRWGSRHDLYAIEMERERYKALRAKYEAELGWQASQRTVCADAFAVGWDKTYSYQGATVVFLNPPYDVHPIRGRLEEAFLERFTSWVLPDGVLILVVPHYALKASATTLATFYRNVHVYRFADEDFAAFKQVVLVAERREDGGQLDPVLYDRMVAVGTEDPHSIEVLADQEHVVTALSNGHAGFGTLVARETDYTGLCAMFRPWHATGRKGTLTPVETVMPAVGVESLLVRTYPMAQPPKPGHMVTGIAAGVFNGKVVQPSTDGLPPLLIKGCFRREWYRLEDKVKDGEVVSQVQVQQPQLEVSVFDLSTHRYHVLDPSAEPTFATTVRDMSTADIIRHYGAGLIEAMQTQCPVGYNPIDPAHQFPLTPCARPLYKAQEHVVRAALQVLGGPRVSLRRRRGKFAIILGEIGSGKTSIAASILQEVGSKSALCVCPPHLVTSWTNQIREVTPERQVHPITSVTDLAAYRALCIADPSTPRLALLTREAAKLGHERVAATHKGRCPRCDTPVPEGDLAKQRVRCSHVERTPRNAASRIAVWVVQRAYVALGAYTKTRTALLPPAVVRRLAANPVTPERAATAWDTLMNPASTFAEELIRSVFAYVAELESVTGETVDLVRAVGVAIPTWALPLYLWGLYSLGVAKKSSEIRQVARECALRLDPDEFAVAVGAFAAVPESSLDRDGWGYSTYRARDEEPVLVKVYANLQNGVTAGYGLDANLGWRYLTWNRVENSMTAGGVVAGTPAALGRLVDKLVALGTWVAGQACGEVLYQGVAVPTQRVPLASHIVTKHRDLFDVLVADEVHELSGQDSAQGIAGHALMRVGWPTLLLTGTISNGYASSFFATSWATNPMFREEFARDAETEFVNRYGYRKRLVQDIDKDTKAVVAYGTYSDRVERSIRVTGNAPGILPLYVVKYLLPFACVLHKTDAVADLPPLTEERIVLNPTTEQLEAYRALENALVTQMRKDMFKADVAGKLFGALAELPSYLDQCSPGVGNTPEGNYVVSYPNNVGGQVIATGQTIDGILPKEQWMLDTLQDAIDAGENVLVFTWHDNVAVRLMSLIKRELKGYPLAHLVASKVPTKSREAWIDKTVVSKGVRVMVVNPATVQTGLNNLVHFSRILVMENPACNPITFRQAIGRIDRIGQTRPTTVQFPVYKDTLQEAMHRLLLIKVAVSRATDGLDAEGAMHAAGLGTEGTLSALSVGKALADFIKHRDQGTALF